MTPAARAGATRRANRTHCKHGHPFDAANTYWRRTGSLVRDCRACNRRYKGQPEIPKSEQAIGLVAPGKTIGQIRAILAVQTKRERYGANTGNRDTSAACRARRTGTRCQRGHAFTKANTRLQRRDGRIERSCKTCAAIRAKGRPSFVEHQGVRISITAHDQFYRGQHHRRRQQMIAAHPDKGGTPLQFIRARNSLDRFVRDEAKWYAALHLSLPTKREAA